MRSPLACTMDSMYGRDGTDALSVAFSCEKERPKFPLTGCREWNERGGVGGGGGGVSVCRKYS